MLMDPKENCRDPRDGDEGSILPEINNEDKDNDHFKWWRIVW
jgi:hypothetical protein